MPLGDVSTALASQPGFCRACLLLHGGGRVGSTFWSVMQYLFSGHKGEPYWASSAQLSPTGLFVAPLGGMTGGLSEDFFASQIWIFWNAASQSQEPGSTKLPQRLRRSQKASQVLSGNPPVFLTSWVRALNSDTETSGSGKSAIQSSEGEQTSHMSCCRFLRESWALLVGVAHRSFQNRPTGNLPSHTRVSISLRILLWCCSPFGQGIKSTLPLGLFHILTNVSTSFSKIYIMFAGYTGLSQHLWGWLAMWAISCGRSRAVTARLGGLLRQVPLISKWRNACKQCCLALSGPLPTVYVGLPPPCCSPRNHCCSWN